MSAPQFYVQWDTRRQCAKCDEFRVLCRRTNMCDDCVVDEALKMDGEMDFEKGVCFICGSSEVTSSFMPTCSCGEVEVLHKCDDHHYFRLDGCKHKSFQKADAGKPRPDLLPPHATMEVSRVLAFGAAKYGANNWNRAEVSDGRERYIAAALRHVLQYQCGEQIDGESGLNHLAHAVASLSFVLERDITEE